MSKTLLDLAMAGAYMGLSFIYLFTALNHLSR
jgi:hypothetical protein